MTDEPDTTADRTGAGTGTGAAVDTTAVRTERGVAAATVVGTVLAMVGLVGGMWRPVAPALPPGLPEQARFDDALLTAIGANLAPRLVLAPVVTGLALVVPLLVLSPPGRRLVATIVGARRRGPWRAGLVVLVVAIATSLATLPASAWLALVHEVRWGFRTGTSLEWLRDWLIVSAGRWLLVSLGTVALFAAIARWPVSWPHRVTIAATAAAAVLIVVHPVLLQPLLLRTQPLPAGPLRDDIEAVAAAAGAADLPIVVADASRRTTRVNALVTGLGPTEQIVLFDNLLELEPEQVVAVVAHELAHWEHADILRGTGLTAAAVLPLALVLRRLLASRRVRARAGAGNAPADPRLVVVVIAFAAVAEFAGAPVAGAMSRRVEAAADHRALELGADPVTQIRVVRTFVARDLADPSPSPIVLGYYGTHPSPQQRIRAAVAAAEQADLPLPSRSELEAAERPVRHPRAGTP